MNAGRTSSIARSAGRRLAARIRQAGHDVEVHDDHLPRDAPDEAWLELCGQRGWIALTVDRLHERPNQREEVLRTGARVVIVRAGRRSGTQIADLVVRKLRAIEHACVQHPPPFLATLSSARLRHVDLRSLGRS